MSSVSITPSPVQARSGQDLPALRPPFRVDYGTQITVATRTFANYGPVALDVARIIIGDDVQIGPNHGEGRRGVRAARTARVWRTLVAALRSTWT